MSYIYSLGPNRGSEQVVTITKTRNDCWGGKHILNSQAVAVTPNKADEFVNSYNQAGHKDNKRTALKGLIGGLLLGGLAYASSSKILLEGAAAQKGPKLALSGFSALLGGICGIMCGNTKKQDKVCEEFLAQNQ